MAYILQLSNTVQFAIPNQIKLLMQRELNLLHAALRVPSHSSKMLRVHGRSWLTSHEIMYQLAHPFHWRVYRTGLDVRDSCLRRKHRPQTQNYAPSLTHTQAPASRCLIVGSPMPPEAAHQFYAHSNNFSRPLSAFRRRRLALCSLAPAPYPYRAAAPAPRPRQRQTRPDKYTTRRGCAHQPDAALALSRPCEIAPHTDSTATLLFLPVRSPYCMSSRLRTTIAWPGFDLLAPYLTFHYLHSLI